MTTAPTGAPAPVLFLNHSGHRSGAEKVLLDLVDEASRRGHPVTVACPDGPLVDALPEHVRRVAVPELGGAGGSGAARVLTVARLAAAWARAARVVRAEARRRPGTRIVSNSLMATPVLRLAGVEGTWLVHDTVRAGKQRLALRIAGTALRRAVAVSELTARSLPDRIPVVVRLNGIAQPTPDLSHEVHDPAVVGILAALTPWKGHRLLLEAVALVPGVRLEIAGTGFPGEEDYEAGLRERASRPDLLGRVAFLGHVRPADVLASWDLAVNCSELPEAGPISVLEILGSGVPMVVSPRTSYVFPGVCVEVRPDDAEALAAGIREVLSWSPEERRRRAAAGRAAVSGYHDLRSTVVSMFDALVGPGPVDEEHVHDGSGS